MVALFAAQQAAAAASGLAGGLVPAISASTLDGFAVGMLLSGGVFLLITAHGQGPRRAERAVSPQPASQRASVQDSQRSGQELGEYPLPAPVAESGLTETALSGTTAAETTLADLGRAGTALPGIALRGTEMPGVAQAATALSDVLPPNVLADALPEAGLPPDSSPAVAGPLPVPGAVTERPGLAADRGAQRRVSGYQSRHRQSGLEESRPWPAPDGRRHAPRHAAPTSSSLARRVSALAPVRMLAASHRAA